MSLNTLFRRLLTVRLRGPKTLLIKRVGRRHLLVESLEDRVVPSVWNNFNGNPQHTGISTVAAQPTDQILWQTSLDQQGGYFWHTGEPVFTPNDTVIVPIITSTGDTFEVEAFNGVTGTLLWTSNSGYIQPSYSWLPPYQPVYDSVTNRVYFAGPGGTLYYISNPDDPGSSTPTPSQVAFYGTSNYTANESAYNSSIYIDTPLTVDNSGNVFFGFEESGSNPSGIGDGGLGRVSATGAGTYVTVGSAVGTGSGSPALGSDPAVSNDGSVVYAAVNDNGNPYLVGVNATTMAPEYSVELSVPNSDTAVGLIDVSTASPMVAPDGTVFMGVFADSYDGSRGFMTHYSANLATEYTPGAFGWDDTASIIPTSMVPSYTGTSSYLIITKYNNYVAGETGSSGGNGVNEIAVLDPYATETDPNNDANPDMLVMKQILTVTSPTEDSDWVNSGYPDATREWCTNGTAVDPATDSVFINNEDGYSYRWDLATDTITQAVEITNGYGEPYTPTSIGPNGEVYAINGGSLFALGGYSNYTLTNVSSLTPAVAGQSVTFNTTLASTDLGYVPAGSITYSYTSGTNDPLDSTPVVLGTVPLVYGHASLTTSALLPDHYHLTATYSGDATDGYAAGSTTLVQVVLANPTTTVSSSASTITSGQSVTFTATVDPDGQSFVPLGSVTFLDGSTALATVALNSLDQSTANSSSQVATFTTSSLPSGVNSITAVYSGDLNFDGSSSTAFAQTVNQAPAFTSSSAASFTVGATNSFTLETTGYPAPTFAVTTGTLPNGLTLDATTGILSGNPAVGTTGVYNLVITASNGLSPNATQNFTLTVNTPPTITVTTLPDWTANQPYSQTITVTGGSDPITFAVTSGSLPTGLSLDSSTGEITGSPTTVTGSPFSFTITATDAANATTSQNYAVAINPSPTIATTSLPNWTIDQPYSQTVGVTGGSDPITFALSAGNLPTGLSLNSSTGEITGTPTTTTGSPFDFTITATDAANATTSQSYTVAINPPPTIATTTLPNWTEGQPYSQTIAVTGGTDPITFALSAGNLPTGLSLNSGTGAITGTPTTTTGSPFSFTIQATDAASVTATRDYTVAINPMLSITPTLPVATAEMSYDQTLAVSGGTTPYTSLIVTNFDGGSTGLTYSSITTDASTGTATISGTPTVGGTATFTLSVTDTVGATLIQNYTLTVDQSPAITSSNNTTFKVGASGSFTATASGYPAPSFSETGPLPSGISLTAAGVLSGLPAAGSGGSYPITLKASNGVSPVATQSYTITVDQAPVITSLSTTTFNVGSTGSFSVAASGYPTPTFAEYGLLPSGVTLTSAGVLGGIPADGSGGTYPIAIVASNGVSPDSIQSFTLTVDKSPAITSSSGTTFTLGTSGSFTVTASGYPAPSFSETGPLPSGVTLSSAGVLSGTPIPGTAGSYPIFIVANNGVSPDSTQSFTLTISQTPSVANSFITVSPGSIQAGSTSTITLHAVDASGNDLTVGGLHVVFALGSGTGGQGTITSATDNGNGTYTATFTGKIPGSNTITATIDGQPVTAAPPSIAVTPGPIDLSHSQVSTLLSSVQLGGETTILLQGEDAYGNRETSGGLTDIAFELENSTGGHGTIGTVTDNGNGTYTATFIGTVDGPNTIEATIGGSLVASMAPISVAGAAVNLANSLLSVAAATVQSGSGIQVSLQAESAKGVKESSGGLIVAFGLGSGSGGQGTFGPVSYLGNGVYTATFTGTLAGKNTLTATVDGLKVTSKAPAISVLPGVHISDTNSLVTVAASSVKAGSTTTITFQPRDAAGNKLNVKGLTVLFALGGNGPAQGTFSNGGVAVYKNGVYTATFKGTLVGGSTIVTTVNNQTIVSNPAFVSVTPGTALAANSILTISEGADTVSSGSSITLMVQAVDAEGNLETTGGLKVAFKLASKSGGLGTFGKVTDNKNGTYTVTFTGTTAGTNIIEATIGGAKVTTTEAITVV